MEKFSNLQKRIKDMSSVLVAYSGGVDSSLLLAVALEVLGKDNILAVTLESDLSTPQEIETSIEVAKQLQAPHLIIPVNDLDQSKFISNDADRCYHCKKHRFEILKNLAFENQLMYVVEGSNIDDLADYRPGKRAAAELSIKSPLQEAGLTKDEIRLLARQMNLPVWNKPSQPCLATRIPYGTIITREALARIKKAEELIQSILGHNLIRVRHHGSIARLEIPTQDFLKVIEPNTAQRLCKEIQKLGYTYVTLDIGGYRQGSLNETLQL